MTTQDKHLPALNQFVGMAWGIVRYDKLLVRNEYLVAKQALEIATYRRGAYYVTGQPGIGKTLFLIYLLVQRLGDRQVVVLQFLGREDYYALFRDTVTFRPVSKSEPLDQCPSVWALCDSNADATSPPSVFKGQTGHVRIIQTTPPRTVRCKEWSKQVGAKCYIMDIRAKEEVVDLGTLLGLDVQRMTTLAKKWGNLPRGLLEYIDLQDWEIRARYRNRAGKAVEQCKRMMDEGV